MTLKAREDAEARPANGADTHVGSRRGRTYSVTMADGADPGKLVEFYSHEVADRAERPLGGERETRLADFVAHCSNAGYRTVLEVGSGAGRDGRILAAAGLQYTGIDLTPASVAHCRALGLDVVHGSAQELPFPDASFDDCWTMSTLMHLPDVEFDDALDELRRVIRPGGVVEIGVWGHASDGDWIDEHGRYFRHRSKETLLANLRRIGEFVDFATWSHFDDGGHYQWARILRH